MENKREDHLILFANQSDLHKAESRLPIRTVYGEAFAAVDGEALTAAEVHEILEEARLDGKLVNEAELEHSAAPGM